jgi:hypothetical protein
MAICYLYRGFHCYISMYAYNVPCLDSPLTILLSSPPPYLRQCEEAPFSTFIHV